MPDAEAGTGYAVGAVTDKGIDTDGEACIDIDLYQQSGASFRQYPLRDDGSVYCDSFKAATIIVAFEKLARGGLLPAQSVKDIAAFLLLKKFIAPKSVSAGGFGLGGEGAGSGAGSGSGSSSKAAVPAKAAVKPSAEKLFELVVASASAAAASTPASAVRTTRAAAAKGAGSAAGRSSPQKSAAKSKAAKSGAAPMEVEV
jgi:hypothetical protein